jgi:hypothetical protein
MALHGGILPYGGTFLIFSDYMRPSVRLAALMGARVIYVYTHDSIGLGEDGPTHQPIEQLSSLRAIPGLTVVRPADANETAVAWKLAVDLPAGPLALILTRQKLPFIDRSKYGAAEGLMQGAYVLADPPGNAKPRVVLMASGSEVQLVIAAQTQLAARGVAARVVSMPSMEVFERQPAAYRDAVLPPGVPRVAIEAAQPMSWYQWVGLSGQAIGLHRLGAGSPYDRIDKELGVNAAAVREAALRVGSAGIDRAPWRHRYLRISSYRLDANAPARMAEIAVAQVISHRSRPTLRRLAPTQSASRRRSGGPLDHFLQVRTCPRFGGPQDARRDARVHGDGTPTCGRRTRTRRRCDRASRRPPQTKTVANDAHRLTPSPRWLTGLTKRRSGKSAPPRSNSNDVVNPTPKNSHGSCIVRRGAIASATPQMSGRISVTCWRHGDIGAVPIAIPTSARARAGASLMRRRPSRRRHLRFNPTIGSLLRRNGSPGGARMPASVAMLLTQEKLVVAASMTTSRPRSRNRWKGASATTCHDPRQRPLARPPTATNASVFPASAIHLASGRAGERV